MNLTKNNLLKCIKEKYPFEKLTKKTLIGNTSIDSLDMAEIIMHVEETFDISISDKTWDNFKKLTIGELIDNIIGEIGRLLKIIGEEEFNA